MTRFASLMQGRGAGGLVAIQSLALLPPLGVSLWHGGTATLGILLAALLVVLIWDYAFAALRHRRFEPHGLTTAAIFTLFVPADMPLWHLVVVLSLGCVIGERIFGGRGFAFLSPATVALALGLLSLPDLTFVSPSSALALACLPGAALLLATGLLSLRIALSFLVVMILVLGVSSFETAIILLTTSSVALVFLICDPTSAAVTSWGRVLHGALAGGLAWVFAGLGDVPPGAGALVFAALMASLMAPLIDHIVLSFNAWRRQRHYG